ncbi:MAG: hypothetical protein JO026_02595, partial [Patescibacteria group bacterium]|nr:hypothetical protein [Patescibacteria group bacterium]
AVKTQNGQSYVLAFDPPLSDAASSDAAGILPKTLPVQIPVETGISDDMNIEITSGLNAGEQIVVRTVTANAASAASRTTTSVGAGRGGFGGGGFGGARGL